jgi:hypothetical protein
MRVVTLLASLAVAMGCSRTGLDDGLGASSPPDDAGAAGDDSGDGAADDSVNAIPIFMTPDVLVPSDPLAPPVEIPHPFPP